MRPSAPTDATGTGTAGGRFHPQGRILVGVDGSPPSVEALIWAAKQAALTGGPLDVLMTWHLPVGDPLASIDDDEDLLADAERVLAQTITSVLGDSPGIEYSAEVMEAPPAVALLEAAVGAELLVLGSRGRGELAGVLLGSVTQHCITHAPCPVVVVRHSTLDSHPDIH
jgi:nucleotide-binding universal stress UspA family protein